MYIFFLTYAHKIGIHGLFICVLYHTSQPNGLNRLKSDECFPVLFDWAVSFFFLDASKELIVGNKGGGGWKTNCV